MKIYTVKDKIINRKDFFNFAKVQLIFCFIILPLFVFAFLENINDDFSQDKLIIFAGVAMFAFSFGRKILDLVFLKINVIEGDNLKIDLISGARGTKYYEVFEKKTNTKHTLSIGLRPIEFYSREDGVSKVYYTKYSKMLVGYEYKKKIILIKDI